MVIGKLKFRVSPDGRKLFCENNPNSYSRERDRLPVLEVAPKSENLVDLAGNPFSERLMDLTSGKRMGRRAISNHGG